jgi:hypothetical protein
MTTGRSGTSYLARLLQGNLPEAVCYHEIIGWDRFGVDTPDLSHMTLFNSEGNVKEVQSFWRAKLGRIAQTPRRYYVETSHLLMKAGLIENLSWLTSEGTVHLIALERDLFDTIMSFRSRLDFLNKGNVWLWYLDPEYPRNLVPSRDLVAAGVNGFCLWYILEIRARAAHYEQRLAGRHGIVVHRFDLEELRAADGVSRLLRALGAPAGSGEIRVPSPTNVSQLRVKIDTAEEAGIRRLIAMALSDPRFAAATRQEPSDPPRHSFAAPH